MNACGRGSARLGEASARIPLHGEDFDNALGTLHERKASNEARLRHALAKRRDTRGALREALRQASIGCPPVAARKLRENVLAHERAAPLRLSLSAVQSFSRTDANLHKMMETFLQHFVDRVERLRQELVRKYARRRRRNVELMIRRLDRLASPHRSNSAGVHSLHDSVLEDAARFHGSDSSVSTSLAPSAGQRSPREVGALLSSLNETVNALPLTEEEQALLLELEELEAAADRIGKSSLAGLGQLAFERRQTDPGPRQPSTPFFVAKHRCHHQQGAINVLRTEALAEMVPDTTQLALLREGQTGRTGASGGSSAASVPYRESPVDFMTGSPVQDGYNMTWSSMETTDESAHLRARPATANRSRRLAVRAPSASRAELSHDQHGSFAGESESTLTVPSSRRPHSAYAGSHPFENSRSARSNAPTDRPRARPASASQGKTCSTRVAKWERERRAKESKRRANEAAVLVREMQWIERLRRRTDARNRSLARAEALEAAERKRRREEEESAARRAQAAAPAPASSVLAQHIEELLLSARDNTVQSRTGHEDTVNQQAHRKSRGVPRLQSRKPGADSSFQRVRLGDAFGDMLWAHEESALQRPAETATQQRLETLSREQQRVSSFRVILG